MRFLRLFIGTLAIAGMLCGCGRSTFEYAPYEAGVATANIDRTLNFALSWPRPGGIDALLGARLFQDGPRVDSTQIAITRAILRTNPRITAIGALRLAGATVRAARMQDMEPEFLAATLLQESAYDPNAISSAGALGIAQFMPDTARDEGVDPFDPLDAIAGSSRLLGSYVRAYAGVYSDPYAAALAAYNAGPGAVERYHGIPPYAETRDYVATIY